MRGIGSSESRSSEEAEWSTLRQSEVSRLHAIG